MLSVLIFIQGYTEEDQIKVFCHTGVKFQGHTLHQFEVIELEARPPLKKNWFFWVMIKLRL